MKAWYSLEPEGKMETTSGWRSSVGVAAPSALSARRAVQAAYLGFFVDMFDVYLPIAVLAPALPYFIPGGLSGPAQASVFYVVFVVTLIGRPLGAVVFGHVADRLGRRIRGPSQSSGRGELGQHNADPLGNLA